MNNKNIILIIVIILIIAFIIILENQNVNIIGNANKKEINVINSTIAQQKATQYPKAVEIYSPDGFINADNFTLSQYIGKKVIIVDFWTYSCINCLRTLPYLNSWYDKYKDQGLLIVGVHTPEFDFEKNYSNVLMAVQKYGIKYPVVLDNEYGTWQAYNNHYWPAEYMIDIDGFIVHQNFGEGNYNETEKEIQALLEERNQRLGLNMSINDNLVHPEVNLTDFSGIQTPEIYFGYSFSRNQMGNSEGYRPGNVVNYSIPSSIENNLFYLAGSWLNNQDNVEAVDNSSITLNYHSKQVNLVAGADSPVNVSIYIDDKFIQNITISNYQLYTLYSGNDYGDHKLIMRTEKGLKAFTFTFG